MCKIVYEGSISAGVRRIEAITGEAALRQYQETTGALRRIAEMMHAAEPELVEHVEKLLAAERAREHEMEQLKEKLAQAAAGGLEAQARTVNGSRVLAARLDGMDRQQMRSLADSLRNEWKTAVVVLASAEDGNVSIIAAVTKDLTAKVHAGKLAGAVAQAVGGKGGGRPDMAEGGGKDAALGALDAALEASVSSGISERPASSSSLLNVPNPFDVSGGGRRPTGLACGIELQQRGVRAVIIEKGCVVNSIYHYPTNMTFFTTPELLEIGNIPMTSLNEKPNRH